MGKRELLIILAFIVAGGIAYKLTAPAAKPGEGFSFSRLWSSAKRNVRTNASSTTISKKGTIPVSSALEELRITSTGTTRVFGEDRKDITYELEIESTGPDEATARQYAERTVLTQDDQGSSFALRVSYPREGQQRATFAIHVPARLAVKIDGSAGATVKGLTKLALDINGGQLTAEGVTGEITGYHRQGEITIIDCGTVTLTLAGSRARFSHVLGKLTLNARSGRSDIRDSVGPIEIDGASQEIEIVNAGGPVRIIAREGRVKIDRPRAETRVDTQRTEVDVTMEQAVPLSLLTTDKPLRLWIDGTPAITLDAVSAEGGRIQVTDVDLAVESGEREQRARHVFGPPGGPRVTLRNRGANIVIGKAK
jgi:hypothetical protein